MLGPLLFHTFLGKKVDDQITCSDASDRGGAIAVSSQVSAVGSSFLNRKLPVNLPQKIPIYVISLFNGVGGCFRCFDIAGLAVAGGLACDINGPGHRVTSRRWPWVTLWRDIRTLTKEVLRKILEEAPPFCEIHVWSGFPCVDLSSAKAHRQNLDGPPSSLIYEAVRVIQEVKTLFPNKPVHFVIENVASMDGSARAAILELLQVQPLKLDPCNQVPTSRPRLCGTTLAIPSGVKGLELRPNSGYTDMLIEGTWPQPEQWLAEDSFQTEPGVTYHTFMKSIVRERPPPRPAGVERCCPETLARWASHSYRFPPYQYKQCYLIWCDKKGQYRLLLPEEREALMGMGRHHTAACFSASKAKQLPQQFLDCRLSLIGDSFACSSFMNFCSNRRVPMDTPH